MKEIFLSALLCISGILTGCQTNQKAKEEKDSYYVLAYVTAGATSIPDTKLITHINYAFGVVNETFNGIDIQNKDRLLLISGLKEKAPRLKVLLSIGGWGAGRFSEMAGDEENRLNFAKDCKRIIDKFNLDGIDLDWEYPTSDAGGLISCSPDDTKNFTLLVKDIREEIGEEKLLTFASISDAKYYDYKDLMPYIDFINIMTYDMNLPPQHQSALYKCKISGHLSVDESVKAHLSQGVPANKLLLGVPFYGRGGKKLTTFVDYKKILEMLNNGYTEYWDSIGCVPYLRDAEGDIVCAYDSPKSIGIKCQYIKSNKLKGIMYWQYDGDDKQGSLRKAAFKGLQ